MGINWQKTSESYPYDENSIESLENKAKKHVYVTCENLTCSSIHRERLLEYGYALKKVNKAKSEDKPFLCQTCSHAHRIGKTEHKKENKIQALPLPPEVNSELTKERFGYYPEELANWSKLEIVIVCGCGKENEIKRSYLNTYKTMIESNHYKCVGCVTREKRTGFQVSEETKQKQKIAQQKRREIEQANKNNDKVA